MLNENDKSSTVIPENAEELDTFNLSAVGAATSVAATGPYYTHPISNVHPYGNDNVDSLLVGTKWQDGSDKPAALTYSFGGNNSRYDDDYYDPFSGRSEYEPGSQAFSPDQQNATRKALGLWEAVAKVTFSEVQDSANVAGDLRFARSDFAPPAHAYVPFLSPKAGDVWFSNDPSLDDVSKRSYGFATTIHEIGHALGLDHPHDDPEYPGDVPASRDADWLGYSVMSYRSFEGALLSHEGGPGYTTDRFPTTPMLNDIRAIQHIYGANTKFNAGNTPYC